MPFDARARLIPPYMRAISASAVPRLVPSFAPMRELSLAVGWKMFQEVRACFLDETPFSSFRLTVPTTMALGDRTTVASRAMSQGLARSHSNVALVEIGGVGHMAPLTHPARVHEALAQHFAHFEEARA